MSHPRRPPSPAGTRVDGDPVRSFRMDDATYQAIRAKAWNANPPRSISDLTRALLEAWLDDELDVRFLGDIVVPTGRSAQR